MTHTEAEAREMYAEMMSEADAYTDAVVSGDADAAERIGAELLGEDAAADARRAGELLSVD